MNASPISGFEAPYKLLRRFEALIENILALNSTIKQVGYVRYKPLFSSYNSCIKKFKSFYSEEFKQLGLEDLSLYDEEGKEQFTVNKLSTLLHQSQAVVGVLKGLLPPSLIENPGGITFIVSSQAASQSDATASAKVNFTIVLEGLYKAIQQSEINGKTKGELLKELEELKNLPHPNESKVEAFSTKLGKKLQEIGENVTSKVIADLLKTLMGL